MSCRAHGFTHRVSREEEEEQKGQGRKEGKGIFVFLCLLSFSLLLLLLSVCDDIADVLVVYVAGNIWGEGGPHVLNLWRTNMARTLA